MRLLQGKPWKCLWIKPSADGHNSCCFNAHAPEPQALHWKQHMHLNWQCFTGNAGSVSQITALNNIKLHIEDKLTVQVHKTWQGSLSLTSRDWGELFKQELIHMENHLPRICLLLHSDPRHQEVNNSLHKHWVLTQNHVTLNSQKNFLVVHLYTKWRKYFRGSI